MGAVKGDTGRLNYSACLRIDLGRKSWACSLLFRLPPPRITLSLECHDLFLFLHQTSLLVLGRKLVREYDPFIPYSLIIPNTKP